MRLTDFEVLTFDCYGTLIDWESGISTALGPLLQKSGQQLSRDAVLEQFARHEFQAEAETPGMLYSELLTEVHRRLAREWQVDMPDAAHATFGGSVPNWPAFPDSAAALHYLKDFFKLVILSNVDRQSFAGSNKRLGVMFDAIYTAQDIGSYKPDLNNFRYLLDHLAADGTQPGAVLHTAQSLFHDHKPAQEIGLATAWIDRRHAEGGWGATMPQADAKFDFRFISMAEMVEVHRAERLAASAV